MELLCSDVELLGDPERSGEVGMCEGPGVWGKTARAGDAGTLGVSGGLEMSNWLRYE